MKQQFAMANYEFVEFISTMQGLILKQTKYKKIWVTFSFFISKLKEFAF